MQLTVLPVGAHWFARLRLPVAVIFGPTVGVVHPRGTLEGVVLSLVGGPPSLRSPLRLVADSGFTEAGRSLRELIAQRAQPGLAFMVSPRHMPSGRCVWLVCAARSGGQGPEPRVTPRYGDSHPKRGRGRSAWRLVAVFACV